MMTTFTHGSQRECLSKLDHNSKINYLCYVRPGYEEQFRYILRSANLETQTLFVSDFKSLRSLSWVHYLKFEKKLLNISLNEEELQESILRCRLLRSLDKSVAEELFLNAFFAFVNLVEEHDIREVFGLCIDSYVGDALRLAVNRNGGHYNGLVVSFIQGYYRITERGEQVTRRSVEKCEVDRVYMRILSNKNRAHFLPTVKRNALVRGAKEVKCSIVDQLRFGYYWSRKLLNVEDNYHTRVNAKGISGVSPVLNGYERCCTLEGGISPSLKAYLPLQVSPEATIDYWSKSLPSIDYENFVLSLVRCFPSVEFFIKENPSHIVRRSRGFYKALYGMDNVRCVDINMDSSFLIQRTDMTITVTGSVGIEALIHGKPSILLGDPYYRDDSSPFFLATDIDKLNESMIKDFIEGFYGSDVSRDEHVRTMAQKEFISSVLSGLVKGDFRLPNRRAFGVWEFDKHAARNVGKSLALSMGIVR